MVVAVVIFVSMGLLIGVPMVIAARVMRSVYTLFTACLVVLGLGIASFLLKGVFKVASDELPLGWAVAVAMIAATVRTSKAHTRFLHAGLGYTAIKSWATH